MARTEKLHSGEKHRNEFDIWRIDVLWPLFRSELEANKLYSEREQSSLIEDFINRKVKNDLRKHIGQSANYSLHIRITEKYLLGCFRKRKQSQKLRDSQRVRTMDILNGEDLIVQQLLAEHVAQNSESIQVGESFD